MIKNEWAQKKGSAHALPKVSILDTEYSLDVSVEYIVYISFLSLNIELHALKLRRFLTKVIHPYVLSNLLDIC